MSSIAISGLSGAGFFPMDRSTMTGQTTAAANGSTPSASGVAETGSTGAQADAGAKHNAKPLGPVMRIPTQTLSPKVLAELIRRELSI